MEHFARKGVRTTAVSRRRPYDTYGAEFISVDLADPEACAAKLGHLQDVRTASLSNLDNTHEVSFERFPCTSIAIAFLSDGRQR